MSEINIRPSDPDDFRQIIEIAKQLPDWFNEDALLRAIPIDIKHQKVFVAETESKIIGFISLFIAEGRMNIGWLGVIPSMQAQGIGGSLLAAAENFAKELHIYEIATYTLGNNVDYQPYESTREFYWRNGFQIYQRSQTDNESCPEEIKIKKMLI